MKKKVFTVFLAGIMFFSTTATGWANAGPSYWSGSNATGAMITDENCPLTVKKEVLDFEISRFPDDFYSDREVEELKEYSDSFTASYTFYNPTDYNITATLAFPLGTRPDYLDIEPDFNDSEKYNVKLNGQNIEKEIRFTRLDSKDEFDFSKEHSKLTGGYIADEFYHPDMTVTKYILEPVVDFPEGEKYIDVSLMWDSRQNTQTAIIPVNFTGYRSYGENKGEFTAGIMPKEKMILYAIGQPLTDMPEFKFFGDKGELSGKMNITSSETALKDYFIALSQEMNVYKTMSDQDIYNIFLTYIKKVSGHYGTQRILELGGDVFRGDYLMCWYTYDITVPAGATVENSVTAPLWPGIVLNYSPNKYEYSYLLSPAQQWAGFDEIEINIKTPHH
ncbi:MAG: hypothetical protein IKJ05_04455, partial [Oscillospiraceae bacterium]|nr:hypothetical protein [Oscillospiraceae bacterium]